MPVLGRLRLDSRALWRAVSAVGRWRHLAEHVRASTRVAGRSCPDGWGLACKPRGIEVLSLLKAPPESLSFYKLWQGSR